MLYKNRASILKKSCIVGFIFSLGLVNGVASSAADPSSIRYQAAYAMPEAHAAKAVEKILAQGGNAVDASITAAFTLAVTFPEAGNIGGGGFMLSRMNGQNYFLDYREKAPLKARRDMYLNQDGSVIEKASLVGVRAAGVPGTVAGMWAAHQKLGSMPWAKLIEPAIELAEKGYKVHPQKAQSMVKAMEWFGGEVNFSQYFSGLKENAIHVQPELANALKIIAKRGREGFYKGELADMLTSQMQRQGGLITQQDLDAYSVVWRKPLIADWRDYQIITAPPPSSGGFAVIQLLKMKEFLAAEFAGLAHNSAQYVHLVAEMEKRVLADRAKYFGDPDFVDVPMQKLLMNEYIQRRAKEVDTKRISTGLEVKPGLESPNTTHFSIIDKWGNAVSNTYTLNWNYGSGVVVEGAGYLLNNEMDDFSAKPGVANIYGVIGGSANAIEPGKRMLSSMTPTILLQDGALKMVVGTPGGSTIFTSVFQAIVNVIEFKMNALEAASASRFHHQLIPENLVTMSISKPLSEPTQNQLSQMGYVVKPHGWEFGDVQLIDVKIDADGNASSFPASDARGIGISGTVEVNSLR